MAIPKIYRGLGVLLALGVPSLVVAALKLPHTFEGGTVIRASEMNENFAALTDAVDALEESNSETGEAIEELEEAVQAVPVHVPAAIELQLGKNEVEPLFTMTQNARKTGEWPEVSDGTAQEVPSAGLYQLTLELAVRNPQTTNPLNNALRIRFGEEEFSVFAMRWSGDGGLPINHTNSAFVRITDPESQKISLFANVEGTTALGGSRMLIQRLGD